MVEEIDICVVFSANAPTPHRLFTCGTLVSVNLDANFELRVPDSVYFPKLKELYLKNVILVDDVDGESVQRLFSSCPVLEHLTIDSWCMQNSRVLNVSNSSLKCLFVFLLRVRFICDYMLLINCPNLEILRVKGYAPGGYRGIVLESLEEVYIENEKHKSYSKDVKLMGLVDQTCKARFVSLACNSMESLLRTRRLLPTFENLTRLELQSRYSEGWGLLPSLLGSTPRLETLVFPKGFYDGSAELVPFVPPAHVPNCLSFHLKLIRINIFCGEKNEYTYVEYFLANALVLEKMEISLWSSGSLEERNDPNGDEEMEGEVEIHADTGANADADTGTESETEDDGEEEEEEFEGELEGAFESNLERHFDITKRLLAFRRCSEVCEIDIISPCDDEEEEED